MFGQLGKNAGFTYQKNKVAVLLLVPSQAEDSVSSITRRFFVFELLTPVLLKTYFL